MAETAPEYPHELLNSIYELGRLYLETGYDAQAERIFSGIAEIAPGQTAAWVGLGLLHLERGAIEEAVAFLGRELEVGEFQIEAKLGLAVACIARGDLGKAKSILVPLAGELESLKGAISPAVRDLWEALALRCDAG